MTLLLAMFANMYARTSKNIKNEKKSGKCRFFIIVESLNILDELVEAIPGVIVLVLGQVVVECLVNGFDVGLYGITDDISYTFGRFFDGLKVQRFIIAVQQVSLGEVFEAVARK